MSPADAKDFYDNALYGDSVEVAGTSIQLSPGRRRHFRLDLHVRQLAGILRTVEPKGSHPIALRQDPTTNVGRLTGDSRWLGSAKP